MVMEMSEQILIYIDVTPINVSNFLTIDSISAYECLFEVLHIARPFAKLVAGLKR